jgi:tRNA-2-methylthio-N6-dimethylallyladenosine synthase
MPRYHIWTIGCQMNKADSEHIAAYLEQMGYNSAPRPDGADVVLLNSCVVRQSAEDKVVHKLESLRSREGGRVLALTGCMVDSDIDGLQKRFPQVDLFFKPQDLSALASFLEDRGLALGGVDPGLVAARPDISVFVNIIQGCDNFCSYCIVPYRRGRERSRPMDEVVGEVEGLAQSGTSEVILLGQNVDSYGHDLETNASLTGLLQGLNPIEGLDRIRFLTSHPKDMSDELIAAMARLDKVCEHVSLPVQAGDDGVLEAMRRGYTAGQYIRLVERVRRAVPHVALSTDVIVGFPGESGEQFGKTYELLRGLRFDTVHVACYSPRTGTIADRRLVDDVPDAEKVRRRKTVEELHEGIATEINGKLMGRTVEVLVEGRKKGRWWGRTRTDKLVFFDDSADRTGQLVNIEITHTGPWSLQGIPVV